MAGFDEDANWSGLFEVEIEGVSVGEFQAVKLPAANVEPIEYFTGMNKTPRKRPGPVKWDNIVLKRGYADNDVLADWWTRIANGEPDRRAVSIIVRNEMGEETKRWNCFGCWPCKWDLADLEAGSTDVSIEEIEIVTERIEVAS